MKLNRDVLYGVAAGVSTILFSSAMYSIDKELFIGSMAFWVNTIILILFAGLAMMHSRSGLEELAGFKDLLKVGFIVYMIGNLIYYIFYFIMMTEVDPGLVEIQKAQAIEFFIRRAGGDETAEIVKYAQNKDYSWTFANTLFAYARGIIFGFVVSAILSLMLKEKPFNEVA